MMISTASFIVIANPIEWKESVIIPVGHSGKICTSNAA